MVDRIFDKVRGFIRHMMRRRFSLYLTFEGWCMVVAMLLIGFAAINTAAPLLYLVFSMMCSFFVLSALLATNTMKSLKPRRIMPRFWHAQEPVRIQLAVRNNKLLTSSFSLRMQDRTPDGALIGAAFFDRIGPRKEERQDYVCVFPRRGSYRIQRLEIASRFPFGLIERTLIFEQPEEILILPQAIAITKAMERARMELGEYEAQRIGPGTGLYGFRVYTPELSARDIHWKVSARRGRLMAREYESEEKRRACVILDNRFDDETRERGVEEFEKAVVLTASVLKWLCDHEHEVELRTPSGRVEFGTGGSHLTRCRRALATIKMIRPDEGDERMLRSSEEDILRFVVSPFRRVSQSASVIPFNVSDFESELSEALQRRTDFGLFGSRSSSAGIARLRPLDLQEAPAQ